MNDIFSNLLKSYRKNLNGMTESRQMLLLDMWHLIDFLINYRKFVET